MVTFPLKFSRQCQRLMSHLIFKSRQLALAGYSDVDNSLNLVFHVRSVFLITWRTGMLNGLKIHGIHEFLWIVKNIFIL